MLKNYLMITVRNMRRYKGYSFINIAGLSFGIALCLLMFLFVQNELSYDNYHDEAENIYRLALNLRTAESDIPMATTSIPVGPQLVSEFPEVTEAMRIKSENTVLVSSDGSSFFYENGFFYAEPAIFDFFNIDFIRGNPETALENPFTVLLTRTAAEKYFGGNNPVGHTITLEQTTDYTVTGVIEDPPVNTHFKYDFLAYYDFNDTESLEEISKWADSSIYTYIKLLDNADAAALIEKFPAFVDREARELLQLMGASLQYNLQPLREIYITSSMGNEIGRTSNILYSYIFSTMALFVLLIACINFMNLATARSSGRAREVGVRKALGAYRNELIRQFLGESVIMTFIAFVFAVLLVAAALPEFARLAELELSITGLFNFRSALLSLLAVFVVGLIAGSYPALFLSAFQPVHVLKGTLLKTTAGINLRKAMVVFQFMVTIILLIGTAVMYKQQSFLSAKEVGFNPEQLLVISLRNEEQLRQHDVLADRLRQHPNVLSVTASNTTPGTNSATGRIFLPEGGTDEDKTVIMANMVDIHFIDTYGFTIIEGRGFSPEYETDRTEAIVINEAGIKRFGWDEPIGKHLEIVSDSAKAYTVIGVVEDFHHFTANVEISPFVFMIDEDDLQYLTLRLDPSDISGTLSFVEDTWRDFAPGFPFEYTFVDEDFEYRYRPYSIMARVAGYFSILAIIIACLGLFGLASFAVELKTKEIGIRKVLGASIPGIALYLAGDFAKWVVASNLIAWPLAYLLMKKWLEEFVYSVELSWVIFLSAGLITLFIAVLTISYQVFKAVRTNPVDALKYE
ncbi:ABC transporter permease [candidate division KSB1 bacterium]